MSITQYLGYSGSGLTRRAKELARTEDAAYVSAIAEHHLSYVRDTVIEEIAVGMEHRGVPREEMQRRVLAIAEQLGITDLLERDPLKLSGGQTRKVTLAAVLVLEMPHVVLDDPFAGLDQESTVELRALLRQLAERTDISLFSTRQHYADLNVQLIGDDPRRDIALPEPVPAQPGLALEATITGLRGTRRKWLTPARTDFQIGPVTIRVPAGGILWLRGSNGSGKTTLLEALADRPDCAYLLQDPHDALIDTTVAAMVPEPWRTRFDLPADTHPFDLSATAMRLAQLGGALGSGRPVLLLDEPDVGLDPRGLELFYSGIATHLRRSGTGIVLVTHQPALIDALRPLIQIQELNLDALS